ncbi:MULTISPECIES: 4-oxalocrotonate tautomerase family protein [unclassified Variovorax]|uniref:tautomerase family protein n=1 Tax=unclassified Variovorax TaxID=663243 RepID=UPI0008D63AE9|nr:MULTISPECIES: 4-oxalocrotonate tautomerase family protein [unclassified Variovorax]SEJ96093.1 4-oxalocrotonate tautomerase [Variovorax sp. OK202]SFD20343.1 4-oxalocrotonate tautomerase [Variovorax sp. OK212]
MPLVTIRLARREPPASKEQKAALIAGATKLMQDVLGKRPEDVTVLIDEIDPDNWGQGGESATVLRQRRREESVDGGAGTGGEPPG